MKKILKKILPDSFLKFIYKQLKILGLKGKLPTSHFLNRSARDTYTIIYKRNRWNLKDSVSGFGSSLSETKIIIDEISSLIKNLNKNQL